MALLSSCQKKTKTNFYYPNLQAFERVSNIDTIRLSSYASFDEFLSDMWNFYRTKPRKTPVVLLEKNDQRFFIKYSNGWDHQPHIVKIKNQIGISKDSVYKWERFYPIDSLKSLLKKDLFNNGANNKLADNPQSFRIRLLHPNKKTMQDIEDSLLHLLDIYNEINTQVNDSLQLNIDLQEFVILKQPALVEKLIEMISD